MFFGQVGFRGGACQDGPRVSIISLCLVKHFLLHTSFPYPHHGHIIPSITLLLQRGICLFVQYYSLIDVYRSQKLTTAQPVVLSHTPFEPKLPIQHGRCVSGKEHPTFLTVLGKLMRVFSTSKDPQDLRLPFHNHLIYAICFNSETVEY